MMIDILFAGALSAGTLAVVMLVVALRRRGERTAHVDAQERRWNDYMTAGDEEEVA